MAFSVVSFWVSVPVYLSALRALLSKWVFRFMGRYVSEEKYSSFSSKSISQPFVSRGNESPSDSTRTPGIKPGAENFAFGSNCDLENTEDEPTFFLRFRFQTYEEFIDRTRNNQVEFDNLESAQIVESAEKRDDEIIHDQSDLASFVSVDTELSDEDLHDHSVNVKVPTEHDDVDDEPQIPLGATNLQGAKNEDPASGDDHPTENEPSQLINQEPEELKKDLNCSKTVFLNLEDEFAVSSDSDSESVVSRSSCSSNLSIWSSLIDSFSDGVLSEFDLGGKSNFNYLVNFDAEKLESDKKLYSSDQNEFDLRNLSKGYETDHFSDKEEEDVDILAELKRIEEGAKKEDLKNHDSEVNRKDMNTKDGGERGEKQSESNDQMEYDYDDDPNEMETEWEHQELIEQLKMEMKKARGTELPTIFEETESLKISEDLKPWKIEEKFVRVGTMDELHKFYKSYRERMRKLDIFNYQKMYAIGFLRLKDPLQSSSTLKSSTPTIMSQDCWPCKPKSSNSKFPMLKFRRELESGLEMVYVGQLCLSWEFLHWQYEKALSLWDSDPRGIRSYSEVVGEFQHFQVLLLRFLEDEPFQCPRVQNFVKNRCAHRQILQVPLIREDRGKQRMAGNSKDSITSLMLVEIVEESIRTLWHFIRADKDVKLRGSLSCRKAVDVELQNPDDAKLLMEVKANLRKKDKKLRDMMRSEHCILKKLQRHLSHEQVDLDEVSCFFSQVDLKLVSRVLNMSRITTDQLGWCSSKLDKVQIVDNKVQIEPSFLLFPC